MPHPVPSAIRIAFILILLLSRNAVTAQEGSVDLLGLASGTSAGGEVRDPIPDEDTAHAAREELTELYPELFKRTRNEALSRWRLFEMAKQVGDEPGVRWCMLERAIELAIDERNAVAVLDLVAYRHRRFDTGGILSQEQAEALRRMRTGELGSALLDLVDRPGDPAVHRRIGSELCFVHRDWARGLPHLAKGDDESLRDLAERESSLSEQLDSDGLAAGVDLGNRWYDAAGELDERGYRPGAYWRAGHHYRRVRYAADGIDRRRIDQRLAERNIQRSGEPVDLFPYLTLEGDKFKGRWSGQRGVLKVERNEKGDHLTLPLRPRGDYRLEVEFSVRSAGEAMFILPLPDTSLCSFVYRRPLTVHKIDDDYIRAFNDGATVRQNKRQFYQAEVCRSAGELDIAVSLDGEPALHWHGVETEHVFTPHASAAPRMLGVLGLGAWQAEVEFYRATITMLSGELEQIDLMR